LPDEAIPYEDDVSNLVMGIASLTPFARNDGVL